MADDINAQVRQLEREVRTNSASFFISLDKTQKKIGSIRIIACLKFALHICAPGEQK